MQNGSQKQFLYQSQFWIVNKTDKPDKKIAQIDFLPLKIETLSYLMRLENLLKYNKKGKYTWII